MSYTYHIYAQPVEFAVTNVKMPLLHAGHVNCTDRKPNGGTVVAYSLINRYSSNDKLLI